MGIAALTRMEVQSIAAYACRESIITTGRALRVVVPASGR
jgi:hypothetical protein